MNLAAVLAELRTRRSLIDAAIVGLEPLVAAAPSENGAPPTHVSGPRPGKRGLTGKTSGHSTRRADSKLIARIQKLAVPGKSLNAVAKKLGVSFGTVKRYAPAAAPDKPAKPKGTRPRISPETIAKIQAMDGQGNPIKQICVACGVSAPTVKKYAKAKAVTPPTLPKKQWV